MEQTRFIDLYVDEMRDNLDGLSSQLVRYEQDPEKHAEILDDLMQYSHTCKSSSSIMQFDNLSELFAALEEIFDAARKEKFVLKQGTIELVFQGLDWALHGINTVAAIGKEPKELPIVEPLQHWKEQQGAVDVLVNVLREERRPLDVNTITSIRVGVRSLDGLVDVAKELSQLHVEMKRNCEQGKFDECLPLLSRLGELASSLKDQVHRCRLVPVGQIVLTFPKLVRDIAQQEGKRVDFSIFSSVSHLDKGLAERIQGPIIHLLRNAVDHGIELPAERIAAGKSEHGRIALRIERTEENIRVIVEDDGQEICVDDLKELALSKGFQKEWLETITEQNVIDLLSNPHFTSSKDVTEVSGRGVGLSAVRNAVESFAGTLQFEQHEGKKRFILTVPAQLSVIESLLVESNGTIYAIPNAYVEGLHHTESAQVLDIQNRPTVTFSGISMPLVWLRDLMQEQPKLSVPADFSGKTAVVTIVLRLQEQRIALAIDQLLLRDTIMIKPMSIGVLNHPLISGPTQLPSGTEVHLLGVPDTFRMVQQLSV